MDFKPSLLLKSLVFISTLLTISTASHIPDFENALDSILCQSVHRMPNSIIDIRQSIDNGADLIGGKWTKDVDNCIADCCSTKGCQFALYKTLGMSTSGKNCYFINCGSDTKNCVKVKHEGFTSVLMASWDDAYGDAYGNDDRSGSKTSSPSEQSPTPQPSTTHISTSPPTTHTSQDTPEPSQESSPVSQDSSLVTQTTIVPSTSTAIPTTFEPKGGQQLGEQPKSKAGAENNQPVNNVPPDNSSSSGVVAIVIVGMVCSLIVVIVVIALARKVLTDMRRKRFRNVDYLINGMYT